jgi:hypothetical protein
VLLPPPLPPPLPLPLPLLWRLLLLLQLVVAAWDFVVLGVRFSPETAAQPPGGASCQAVSNLTHPAAVAAAAAAVAAADPRCLLRTEQWNLHQLKLQSMLLLLLVVVVVVPLAASARQQQQH